MLEFKVLNSSTEDLEDFSLPLANLLMGAVQGGASMGYLASDPISLMENFWLGILENVRSGKAKIVCAEEDRILVGVVVLSFESNPNAKHRAEVRKLIVDAQKRGQGIAKKLLGLLEMEARMSGKSLLVLDTETHSEADFLYQNLGWTQLGIMPRHAASPNGELKDTTYYYKELD